MLTSNQYTEILQNPHLTAWQRGYFERRREVGGRRPGWVGLLDEACIPREFEQQMEIQARRFNAYFKRHLKKKRHDGGQG